MILVLQVDKILKMIKQKYAREKSFLQIKHISTHLGISANFCQFLLQKDNYGMESGIMVISPKTIVLSVHTVYLKINSTNIMADIKDLKVMTPISFLL